MDNSIEAGFKALHAYLVINTPVGYVHTVEHSETEFHRGKWIVDSWTAGGDYLGQEIWSLDIVDGRWAFTRHTRYVPANKLTPGMMTIVGEIREIMPWTTGTGTELVYIDYVRRIGENKAPAELVNIIN